MDLHVHTRYSDHPSEWFLQRLGAAESYSEPEDVYRAAKARGMDFVTITDHNCIIGALELARRHPRDVIVGVETTTYFPEDGCKVHLLLWGITEVQFARVQDLRTDIYALRDYVRSENLAHAVAHATYSVNGRLTTSHIEKLITLFDAFEGMNGARDADSNTTLMLLLSTLDEVRFAELCRKHRIEPFSSESWNKGIVGGSDDHAGLFVGRTFTIAEAEGPLGFLDAIRAKRTAPAGRHNDHRRLAFSLYKIACDFSEANQAQLLGPLLQQVSDVVFAEEPSLGGGLAYVQQRALNRFRDDRLSDIYLSAMGRLRAMRSASLEERLDVVFEAIADVSDEVLSRFVRTLSADLRSKNLGAVLGSVSSALPLTFLAVPFFSTLAHMTRSRDLLDDLRRSFDLPYDRKERVLWFTDTIDDLNGVSVTLRTIAGVARSNGADLRLVTARSERVRDLPEGTIELESVGGFELPYYDRYHLEVPSVLRSIERIVELAPSKIFISTPGPVGLLGLLAARLLNVECVAVYHTDFAEQARHLTEDGSAAGFLDVYTKWFYAQVDEVRVPTQEYMRVLTDRGYETRAMRVFRRGLDTRLFAPRASGKAYLMERFGTGQGPVLVYAGRVSRDKRIEFAAEVFEGVRERFPDATLLIVGDGPHAEELRRMWGVGSGVVFAGQVANDEMPAVYSGCDLMLFPSTTDTFGMAVLEAQACGVPALVTDVGGPKEIVVDGQSGFVLGSRDHEAWVLAAVQMLSLVEDDPERLMRFRDESRRRAVEDFDWDQVFGDIMSVPKATEPRRKEAGRA
ncbi:MAG: glycosyltransferase [Coriobacteriia bacterium]|nr:glycosyltransferase [Coriobacteriia bacterium]